jgi:hypothetical protein
LAYCLLVADNEKVVGSPFDIDAVRLLTRSSFAHTAIKRLQGNERARSLGGRTGMWFVATSLATLNFVHCTPHVDRFPYGTAVGGYRVKLKRAGPESTSRYALSLSL